MRKYKIISIVLLFILLLNGTVVLADTTSAQDKRYENIKKTGDTLGYNEGRSKGYQISSNNILVAESVRPTEEDLAKKYPHYFTGNDETYKSYFVTGYYEGFDRGYYEVLSTRFGITAQDLEMDYADTFGLLYGELAAARDYNNRSASNWVKAIPSDSKIIELFDLSLATSAYRLKFLRAFKSKFKEGYELGYEKSIMEPREVSVEAGRDHGEEVGQYLGMIFGAKDFYDNRASDFKRDLPSDAKIKTTYVLSKDNPQYEESFIAAFKKAYEEGYNTSFRDANMSDKFLSESHGFDNGFVLGTLKGEILANQDHIMNKSSNWRNSGITNTEIIRENKLSSFSVNYRQGFVSGFWAGFSESYVNIYEKLNQEVSVGKSIVQEVPMSGAHIASGDHGMFIDIDEGTFYSKVVLTIDSLLDSSYKLEDKYIKASNYYRIDIKNPAKNYDNTKPITIAFEYYGKSNGGIYKLVNNKWYYISSKIEDGMIYGEVNPRTLESSGVYVVLLHKNLPVLTDARGHWAKDEINTYVRREFISGYTDNTFRPDRNISRAEFLLILSRVYDWSLPSDTSNIQYFRDYENFKSRDKVISYALANGIISGYGDQTFKPDNNISYREVEIIMRRLLDNDKFHWDDTAFRILYNKRVRSSSFDSKDNKITRAEFVYMLYIINEWKY